jgi:hypothetical protein
MMQGSIKQTTQSTRTYWVRIGTKTAETSNAECRLSREKSEAVVPTLPLLQAAKVFCPPQDEMLVQQNDWPESHSQQITQRDSLKASLLSHIDKIQNVNRHIIGIISFHS